MRTSAWSPALCALLLSTAAAAQTGPLLRLDPAPSEPLRFIAYGDMRFTDPAETEHTNPNARQALVRQIAAEKPAVVLLNGDVPWYGGSKGDYAEFALETAVWREQGIAAYPALGNHEFKDCEEADCLENWWAAFPKVARQRWYALEITPRLRAIALDSNAALVRGSPQRAWLERQMHELPASVDFLFVFLHHPPTADLQREHTDHNPRPNERSLGAYLRQLAPSLHARLIVCAGHIHNYERRREGGIVYLVSGGGGAHPVPVVRARGDLYHGPGFPNYHYLRFTLAGATLRGEMMRLADYDAPLPQDWRLEDTFEITARSR
ncbi:MAG: metallophosphoesterase [Gammaproteobacteria bacterium]|nr:metallophosphoesterase [Gammaproteobacteria bacterium]